MRSFLILLYFASAGLAYCPNTDTIGFKNSEWHPNNVLIKLLNYVYDSIALTTADMCSTEKRFMSVFTLAKSYFLTCNDTNYDRAIADSRHRAEKQLHSTAAAIAGTIRGLVDALLVVIDQPMNDVLASCRPETYQDECKSNLNDYRTRYEKECKGYNKNVAIYNRLTRWANRPDTVDYMEDLTHMSSHLHGDTATLDFFQKQAAVKYKAVLKELQAIVLQVKAGNFNCNALSFVNIHCF